MNGEFSVFLSDKKEEWPNCMEKVFQVALCYGGRTVNLYKMAVFCHMGFKNIFQCRKQHHIAVSMFEDGKFPVSKQYGAVLLCRTLTDQMDFLCDFLGCFGITGKSRKFFWKKFCRLGTDGSPDLQCLYIWKKENRQNHRHPLKCQKK